MSILILGAAFAALVYTEGVDEHLLYIHTGTDTGLQVCGTESCTVLLTIDVVNLLVLTKVS